VPADRTNHPAPTNDTQRSASASAPDPTALGLARSSVGDDAIVGLRLGLVAEASGADLLEAAFEGLDEAVVLVRVKVAVAI
jgi:hypothetical protein